ncbi:hypothetical protein EVAR_36365_1 [Eumeta japonica]|uniref:Uncharacterized protein n=1 Tax=Eumeta variegata TaxID=151549 RepID=A0A4C1W8B3_EUMVA|nr:hypothetical protein EVAR_36365_1 [Eumeta japonica]
MDKTSKALLNIRQVSVIFPWLNPGPPARPSDVRFERYTRDRIFDYTGSITTPGPIYLGSIPGKGNEVFYHITERIKDYEKININEIVSPAKRTQNSLLTEDVTRGSYPAGSRAAARRASRVTSPTRKVISAGSTLAGDLMRAKRRLLRIIESERLQTSSLVIASIVYTRRRKICFKITLTGRVFLRKQDGFSLGTPNLKHAQTQVPVPRRDSDV